MASVVLSVVFFFVQTTQSNYFISIDEFSTLACFACDRLFSRIFFMYYVIVGGRKCHMKIDEQKIYTILFS